MGSGERLETIKKAKPELKMIHLTDDERAAFKKASMEARKKFVEMVGPSGQKILDQLESEIKAAEKAQTN